MFPDGTETLLGGAEFILRMFALGDFLEQLLVGRAQIFRALSDGAVEVFDPPLGLLDEKPLPGQGVGDLHHLEGIERLLEDQQAVRLAEAFDHVLPGVIGIGGANTDLEVRIGSPKSAGGFDAIPARGHADIDKGHGIAVASLERALHQRQALGPLESRIKDEISAGTARDRAVEQSGFHVVEGRSVDLGEDLAEVIMNSARVIDNENAGIAQTVG